MSTLAEELKKRLKESHFSKGGKPLFFEENHHETLYAREFADLFSIPETDREIFYDSFKIVTQGQGNEINDVNSVISSALLSLLVFYPLFNNKDKNKYLTINGERYYRCFFEVRNRVIRNPSCVDVVLISTDEKKILFLESKFTEYADGLESKHEYGKGYKSLYAGDGGLYNIALRNHFRLGDRKDKLVLKSLDAKERIYIEGIKQSISHLIGMLRGPQLHQTGYYPEEYHNAYKEYYDKATTIEYATILFDPAAFGVNVDEFNAYSELYRETIIKHKRQILDCIEAWDKDNGNLNQGKKIEILDKIFTYQNLLSDKNNRHLIAESILNYYKL